MLRTFFFVALAAFELLCSEAAAMEEDEAGIWMLVERQEQFLRTSPFRYQDPELEAFVHQIVCDIAPSECSSIDVYILNLPGLNAFMMPNGSMFLQTGLLLRLTSKSELASIVAHEYIHYKNRHSIKNIRRWRKTSNAFAVVGAVVGAAGAAAAMGSTSYEGYKSALGLSESALYMLQSAQIFAAFQLISYQRDDETEADLEGLELIHRAGYSTLAASTVWENYLAEESFADKQNAYSALSTHPMPESRRLYLKKRAEELESSGHLHDDDEIFSYISDDERRNWIADEARAIHPSQFEGLVHNQEKFTNVPSGYHHFSHGRSWELYSARQGISKSQRKTAVHNSIASYNAGRQAESGLPVEGLRNMARLSEATGQTDLAIEALEDYLKLAPDAWDSKFVQKKLEKLRANK